MDDQLNKFLKVLRSVNPTSADMNKWQTAVSEELRSHRRTGRSRWIELVAAACVGAVIGATFFHQRPTHEENVVDNATTEIVVTKLE